MRRRDEYDDEADRLYNMVRDGEDDERVTSEIALALRKAAGVETPRTLTLEEYARATGRSICDPDGTGQDQVSAPKKPTEQP